MRKILFIIVLLTIVACSNSKISPELEEFISDLDQMSLEEIKVEIDNNINQFESFTKFFDGGTFSNEIKKINKEDEQYQNEFKIDTSGVFKALNQFDDVIFKQNFQNNQSHLTFAKINNSGDSGPLALSEGVSQEFIPNKIYYRDGEIKTDSVFNYSVDFNFTENWGQAKPIDSIDINYNINFITDYEVVEVSKTYPKVSYKGGEIKIVKTKDNYIYYTASDTIKASITVQGYNAEGKVLRSSGSSSNGIAPGKMEGAFKDMLAYFKKLQKKLNNNDFKNTAEFQEYLRKNLAGLEFFNDNDGVFHKEYYYYGKVESLKIYFEKDSETRETTFTANNLKPLNDNKELRIMENENETVFLNYKGEYEITLNRLYEGLEHIGGHFYEDSNNYYFLNRAKKQLDTLLVYDVKAFNNGFIGILPDHVDDDYTLYNSDFMPVGEKKYSSLRNMENELFGERDGKYYILDKNGHETLIPGLDDIYDNPADNRIMISNSNQDIGFMNSKGQIVIPFKYDYAHNFKDGITAVLYNGSYKFIDINGKILLDTKEKDLLIKNNEEDNGKRTYSFDYGNKIYNYKGELIVD
ncbi:MAG: WG repeat-containing protein [Xanthomarina sp.]